MRISGIYRITYRNLRKETDHWPLLLAWAAENTFLVATANIIALNALTKSDLNKNIPRIEPST
jgi:hypothetical protein